MGRSIGPSSPRLHHMMSRRLTPQRVLGLIIAALAPVACAPMQAVSWDPAHPRNIDYYQRATPPKPRIPGQASTEYRYASSAIPMKLTASDGTGLILRSLQVEAVVDDPVSLTELHMSFENPHNQTLDGKFELLLPRGAEISRFAMMVDGRWVESEIVERKQAREIYADHKHMRRDPALLERERGRRFSGRIFPIQPRERKQIILSYTNIHDRSDRVFRVPLAGLPRVDQLDLKVTRRRAGEKPEEIEEHSEHEAPKRDFEVGLEGPASVGLSAGKEALLRVIPVPATGTAEREQPKGLTVLIDTSASMAGLAERSNETIAALLKSLGEAGLANVPVQILAFDQAVTPLYSGPLSGAQEPTVAVLRTRARLGASDLGAALDAIAASSDRALLISDGEASAGVDSRYGLASLLDRAAERGLERLDAMVLGAEANTEQLERLVLSERLRAGIVLDATRSAPAAWVDQLLSSPAAPVTVDIAGAAQVWPAKFIGLRPGQAVVVHARFERKLPPQVKLSIGGAVERTETISLRGGDDPLIERSIAVVRVKALMAELEAAASPETRQGRLSELIELSKRHRILSDYTSLLVLESDRAYTEFGIERGSGPTLTLEPGESATTTVNMEQARAIPVGSTSHDFTGVVDISPTASRDSAGMRLAGASGIIDADSDEDGLAARKRKRKRNRRWRLKAEGRAVGPRPAKLPRAIKTFERELDEIMARCARHAISIDEYQQPNDLGLALRFDAQGRLIGVRKRNEPTQSNASLDSCARYLLVELGGSELDERPAKTEPAFEVFREVHIDLTSGAGRPPQHWRIPEALLFSDDMALAGMDGTAGWARFIAEDLEAGLVDEALDVAWTWHRARPDDILPYISLGHALVAAKRPEEAARAFGSLIDLEPTRAGARRFAGALLESLDDGAGLELAIDSYRKARDIRPDQPTSHEALALALARDGQLQAAVNVLVDALGRTYAEGRYGDAVSLMRAELATLAAAVILATPESRPEVLSQLVETMIVPDATPRDWMSLRWENDASALSMEIVDGDGEPYTGGSSVTPVSRAVGNGYGPQGFEWSQGIPGPVRAWVSVGDLGVDGVAMGSLTRVRFDDAGALQFETRPFVAWPGQWRIGLGRFESH